MKESRKNNVAALISFLVAVAVFGVARVSAVDLGHEPVPSTAIADIR